MNPLTFFPPPSRSLSRVESRPSQNGGTASSASSIKSARRGMQPLTMSPSRSGSSARVQTLSSASHEAATLAGHDNPRGMPSGRSTPDHTIEVGSSSRPTMQRESSKPQRRPKTSPALPNETTSPRRAAMLNGEGYASDSDGRVQIESGSSSPRRPTRLNTQSRSTKGKNSGTFSPGGRLGHRLPSGLYFDLLRPSEVGMAHRLEVKSYEQDDTATMETLKTRQRDAPHLFLGAFLPAPPPKVSGPLSMGSGPPMRKLIGFASGTASSALSARAIKHHSDDEHSWLVCLWSVCVAEEYRKKGVGLKLVEEYIRRLRKAEQGQGSTDQPKKGYECVAVLAHEDMIPFFEKASFKSLGVSHVNSGSGGWFELRRYIKRTEDAEEEQVGSGSVGSSNSDTNGARSPLHLSGILSLPSPLAVNNEYGDQPPAAATPTQELERRLQAHVASEVQDAEQTAPEAVPSSFVVENGAETGDMVLSPTVLSPMEWQGGKSDDHSEQGQAKAVDATTDAMPAFSTAKLLQALQSQSTPKVHKGPQSCANPGTAYSTIMGQTLASKTSVEDAYYALEARLVDREDQSNLADLYCPREECSCLILRAGNGDWEIAEMGPLHQANLSLPNSPAPPSTPLPPPPTSVDRIRSAMGNRKAGSTPSTAAQPFWIVHSPMIFENVGFSRDADWQLPPVPRHSVSSAGSEGNTNDANGNQVTSPTGNGAERKPSTKRRGTFLRSLRDTIDRRRSNSGTSSAKSEPRSIDIRSPMSPSMHTATTAVFSSSASSSGSTAHGATGAESSAGEGGETGATNVTGPSKVKVKYLLCAECDCGPLGYTVLPTSMQNGGLARQVGQETTRQMQGDGQGETDADSGAVPASNEQPMQLFFVAADRVRYRLPK